MGYYKEGGKDATKEQRNKSADELIKQQCSQGNWDYDPYMLGMANGMILIKALWDNKEPKFMNPPKEWQRDKLTKAANEDSRLAEFKKSLRAEFAKKEKELSEKDGVKAELAGPESDGENV